MADGLASFKKREEAANTIYNSPNFRSVPLQKATPACKPDEAKGPTCASEQCDDLMDTGEASKPNLGALRLKPFVGLRPKNVKAKRNKAMIVQKTASRCKPSKPIQALVNSGGGRAVSQGIQDEATTMGESLPDSNIENMNHILLKEKIMQAQNNLLAKKIKESEKTAAQQVPWQQNQHVPDPSSFLLSPPLPSLNMGGTYHGEMAAEARRSDLNLSLEPIYSCHLGCFAT
ncbi:Floral homeotic protein APETALA [Ancistrocladus abbreviatus]